MGRDPAQIRRSVQVFIFPDDESRIRELPGQIEAFREAGAEHAVLSFYSAPSPDLLERLAPAGS
ncbi:MAG TPA: hypothetical protein VNE62_05690 [Actinomycetota bacterium]|nr:hypothetical protein [Actinomycetota bacterium]